MLGLCSICGIPVVQNAMRCIECQAVIEAELERAEQLRAIEADECYRKWMNGDVMTENASQSSVQGERIEQPQRKHGPNRRTK